MDRIVLGERLRKLRNDRGWSQGAVADKLGITTSAVSNYENGIREPGLDVLRNLADLYGVSIDEIFDGESEKIVPGRAAFDKEGAEFGLFISRSNRNSTGDSLKLTFDKNRPVLEVNNEGGDFAILYSRLQSEDKIAVCKEMLRRAKEELMRGM